MKAQEKPKYVAQARELLAALNIDALIADPNNLLELQKISRLIGIFTNFSFNDGQELKRLLQVFQKWARSSSSNGTIKNRAVDMVQFIIQKIEEMDIYVIDEQVQASQERIIKNLKDEKLWYRTSLEGKDLHILIGEREDKHGEHVHLISDSDTGEIRVDAGDKSPSELIERVAIITTKSGPPLRVAQYGIKTTMEFVEKDTTSKSDIPILYATGLRRSGGPTGHIEYITIKNIGKSIALDIHWGIRSFSYEWRTLDEPFELNPSQEKEVIYPVSEGKAFLEPLHELNIIMEYKDINGTAFFSRRELQQIKVPTGAFYTLKAGTFYPPTVLVDDGLELVAGPYVAGDGIKATFKINTSGGIKEVKIGMSDSLRTVLDLDGDELIKQALLELGHRKIRKMVRENNLTDFNFSTYDLPEHHEGGFEAYKLIRDAIV